MKKIITMKTFILITILGFMAHTTKAQYNMTPPIPPNFASNQIYYNPNENGNYSNNPGLYNNCWNTGRCGQTYQNQNSNYWNSNQPVIGYNRGYTPRFGNFYSGGGQGIRILRTINDVAQTAGIIYLVISDISDHATSENTVEAKRITRIVTIDGQQVVQEGYSIGGQDYF